MDRPAAWAVAGAIPVLCLAFYLLTRWFDPLTGYMAALGLYWFAVLLPLILWRWDPARMVPMARVAWPGWPLAAISAGLVAAVAAAAVLAGLPSWPMVALTLVGALINGTLEEVFWRGTLLPDPTPGYGTLAAALALFSGWHIALLFADGITMTGGGAGLLGGAVLFGALALALRRRTGGYGTAALVHVAFNIFAFLEIGSRNA